MVRGAGEGRGEEGGGGAGWGRGGVSAEGEGKWGGEVLGVRKEVCDLLAREDRSREGAC